MINYHGRTKSINLLFISKQTKYHSKVPFEKLGIFGSYARNEQTPESDLDLLVDFEDNTPDLTDIKDFL
jgi:predicted nucleotidyltransferase